MRPISSLTKEYVKVPISATASGAAVDPTAGTATMAFVEVGTAPVSGDFKTATWETDATRDPDRYYARCLVGPSGTVTLAADTYDVWVKITGISPEIPVIKADGTLTVT